MYDVAVVNGLVVGESAIAKAGVGIRGGEITVIGDSDSLASDAAEVIDADGLLVLPGGVDPHVHYNLAFGGAVSEGPINSVAAAFGGTTTVIDFAVHTDQPTAHDAVAEKKADLAGQMSVDYGLHLLLTGEVPFDVIDEIGDLIRAGLPTVKTMMTYGWMADDGYRWGVMNAVAEAGGLSVVHAEDDAIANWLTKKYLREGKTHGAYIYETRGSLVEEAAVRRALLLAERAGSPLYVLHIAAASAVDALTEARARNLPCYGETLTPYLSFTNEALWDEARGLLYNNYPTIKSQADQDALWRAIADDRVQVVSSDHFLIKAVDRNTKMGSRIDDLQCGQAGVELRIPVVYSLGVARGRLSLERFVQLVSTNPAKIMGLYPRKGVIAVGSDADLVLLDPERRWVVTLDALHMDSDYSCWESWELTGKVRTVISGGRVLIRDERLVGETGRGRFIERRIAREMLSSPLDRAQTRRGVEEPAGAVP